MAGGENRHGVDSVLVPRSGEAAVVFSVVAIDEVQWRRRSELEPSCWRDAARSAQSGDSANPGEYGVITLFSLLDPVITVGGDILFR